MLAGRLAEVVAVTALATIVTVAIAAPVLRAPSDRVFGMEIVGRHHDPFTVMAGFARPIRVGVYSQPVTDVTGALFARISSTVAAYNWLVLLSFPLSAAAAFLLARYLDLSFAGATIAALAYAFSPFHVAHAAYHPHIAQTQWLPLYLLALWHCLDAASLSSVALLGGATVAVTLSNFYGGFIAAVITPFALAAYWLVMCRARTGSTRRLVITLGSLVLIAAIGMAYVWYAAPALVANPAAFGFRRGDLFRYSAKWWSYLVPPVEHPLLGPTVQRFWSAAGVGVGLLEQQVTLGLGIIGLGLIACVRWLFRDRQTASLSRVPVLVIVAVVALVCSLSPERDIGSFTFVRPSALLFSVAPMFRSYARFGVVVQLMAALLAGIGIDYLRRAATRRAQIAGLVLVALAAGEYAVVPSALSRDVLPTAAHRWVMEQPGDSRALDCIPHDQDSESVEWLSHHRVTLLGGVTRDCTEPDVPQKLAAIGYTFLIVRRNSAEGRWFAEQPEQDGLRVAAEFGDAQVFALTARTPGIYTATMSGFSPRERDGEWAWRWMGRDAVWTIVNASVHPIGATLTVELSAFHRARRLELLLDGQFAQAVVVEPARSHYHIGPLSLIPGAHALVFHAADAPTPASSVMHNGDRRSLSFAVGTWKWTVQDDEP